MFPSFGLLAWIAGSASFRVTGPLDRDEDALALLGLYVVTVPLVAFFTIHLYARYRLRGAQHITAGASLALPGMILDSGSILFFDRFYSGYPTHAAGGYAARLLWPYAVILGVSIFSASRIVRTDLLNGEVI